MNMSEYNQVCDMTYLEYCDYLQKKYGIGKCNYMSKNYNKNPNVTRTSEGLIAHHKMEDRAIMLSNKIDAMEYPIEWQNKENIIYCDYLEHLFLHVLICKYPSPERVQDGVGEGGVVNFIAPELNDVYSGFKTTQDWRKICHEKIINDKDVYLKILRYFVEIHKGNPRYFRLENLFKSFNAQFGLWRSQYNIEIYKEIGTLLRDLLTKRGIEYVNEIYVKLNWINILDVSDDEITQELVNLSLQENQLYEFPYIDEGVHTLWHDFDHYELADKDKIQAYIGKLLQAFDSYDAFEKLYYVLGANLINFWPIDLWTVEIANEFLSTQSERVIQLIPDIVTPANYTYWNDFLQTLYNTYFKEVIKNIDILPEFLHTEETYRILGSHLTQKNRPTWCDKRIWKYR